MNRFHDIAARLVATDTVSSRGNAALMGELADEARAGRGVLVITHEPHGLERFDEVLTLRQGRLERA